MTDAELRQFVLDYCDGRVFTDRDIPKGMKPTQIFIVLAFGKIEKAYLKKVGMVWEHVRRAGPMAVNGCPMFFSAHLMHVEDVKRIAPAVAREMKRRKEIKV